MKVNPSSKTKATRNIKSRDAAVVYINGLRHEIKGAEAFMMLADYLRYSLGMVGTKIVCAEGDCGACSVLKATALLPSKKNFEPINSCIMTMAQLDGSQIVTIEGLQQGSTELTPVQTAVMNCHGSQCGYCTPGFVIALTALCQKGKTLDEQKVKNALTGNLCRCTGYSPLIQAALKVDASAIPSIEEKFNKSKIHRLLQLAVAVPLHLQAEEFEFHAPTTLKEALKIRRENPGIRLISSATDLGVQINKAKLLSTQFLSLHLIPELYLKQKTGNRLSFGARVSLTEVRETCEKYLPEFADYLDIFASPQIKNVATLVGNIANASPIGDTIPFLLVCEGVVEILGSKKSRTLPLTQLFSGYRQLALASDEVITGVSFKLPEKREHLKIYKVSQRKDLDISTVNSAFLFDLHPTKRTVQGARIALGGIGPTARRMHRAESYLIGKILDETAISQTLDIIQEDMTPLSDLRGTSTYRRALIDGLFRKYCDELKILESKHE